MRLDTINYDCLPRLTGKKIILFGTDQNAKALVEHINQNGLDIQIKFFLDFQRNGEFCGKSVYKAADYLCWHNLRGECVVIANASPMVGLNCLLDSEPEEVLLCTRLLYNIFHAKEEQKSYQAERNTIPFMVQSGTPRIAAIVTNAYVEGGNTIYEIADFLQQKYTTYTVPTPNIPVDLPNFSSRIRQRNLPMRMSHLGYLFWKRSTHVVQLSYSRRYIVAPRYNFFHLDVLDTHTGQYTRWHDLPPSEGLWDYVATGDFDDQEDAFYFCRWPLEDAVAGMADGSNKVRMQVGKLHLDTLKADILHEFEFQDRVHQCTISGDGRYMVFAPMRMLLPKQNPKTLPEAEVMRRLQEWVVLDPMATLDLQTRRVWTTQMPYPIPAHFELDPLDPHLFYVSTHSLMPHADGVICFQPGTLHKVRIADGETHIEATYTHSRFVRTTQHCVFVYSDQVLIAATNQNRLEIIRAEDMSLWHCHKLVDDPVYDNADFNDPTFLAKPFSLPPQPAHCDSISASADGRWLILHMTDCVLIFDLDTRTVTGRVAFRAKNRPSSHSRCYMQNAPYALSQRRYAEILSD